MNRNGTQICTFFATLLYHAKSLLSILSETITAYPPNGCLLLTGNDKICYNTYVADSLTLRRKGGVTAMNAIDFFISFLVSAAAGVFGNFTYDALCKWLGGHRK